MVKAKQARNPQFEFLNFEHPLNQYYKHLVQMIKDGKYRPQQDQEEKEEMAGTKTLEENNRKLHQNMMI